MHIILSLFLGAILLSFLPARVYANDTQCLSNDGEWHVLHSDPRNPNNIIIDDEIFYFLDENTINNKKTLTFESDIGKIAYMIIIGKPNAYDAYIELYISSNIEHMRLQCVNTFKDKR